MRKYVFIAALTLATLATGCATRNTVFKASDSGVKQTATGTLVSIEEKRRSNLTVTNTAAGAVAANQGGSALGIAALAVDILDHQAAKDRDRYLVVTINDEKTGKDVVFVSDLLILLKGADVGDRIRLIQKRFGAEAFYNLTRNPSYEELTR